MVHVQIHHPNLNFDALHFPRGVVPALAPAGLATVPAYASEDMLNLMTPILMTLTVIVIKWMKKIIQCVSIIICLHITASLTFCMLGISNPGSTPVGPC